MALTNNNQLEIAYKKLVGKAHTNQNFTDTEEGIQTNVQQSYTTIFAQPLEPLPVTNSGLTTLYSTNGIIQRIKFQIDIIPNTQIGVNQSQGYRLKLPSDWNSHPGALYPKFVAGTYLHTALGGLQIVPSIYGTLKTDGTTEYDPILYQTNGSTVITKFDSINWYIDSYNGILYIQNPPAGYDVSTSRPAFLEAYLYIGDYLKDVIFKVSSGSTGVTATNVGGGVGVFKDEIQLTGGTSELRFKSLTGLNGIAITGLTNDVHISYTGATISALSANNGITKNTNNFQLGGNLTGNTTIGLGIKNLIFTGTTGTVKYGSNLSAQFTKYSHVDVNYVTGLTLTGSSAVFAVNGLTKSGNYIRLGGSLTGNTDIAIGSNNFSLTKNSSQFKFQHISGFLKEVGFDSTVQAIAIQSDGKFIVSGSFIVANSTSVNRIVRLNVDGSVDTSFIVGTGLNNQVLSLVIQPDGKILAGGLFTTYNGYTVNRIVRLNSDGSIDSSFIHGTDFNGSVFGIALQPSDNKIVAIGQFTTFSGITENRIARLNTDGSLDTSFVISTGFGSQPNCVAIQADGKILVGGSFTTYNGVTKNRIVRINSTGGTDSTFNIGTGFNSGQVNSIAIQTDGKILVGGNGFTTYNGVAASRIVRLNTTGGTDSTYVYGTGFNSTVTGIVLQPSDGKSIFFGSFTTYKGVSANQIIRINTTGGTDGTFNVGSGFDNGGISCGAIQSNGKILLGGAFQLVNGKSVNRIIRLNTNGSVDTSIFTGSSFTSGIVYNSLPQSNGKIIVIGSFSAFNNNLVNNIIRITSSGTSDSTFIIGSGFNNQTRSLVIQPDDKIIVGGLFTTYSGATASRIIRLNSNGGIDSTFNSGSGFNNDINGNNIVLQPDGKIIVGGSFTTYSGVTANRIIRLNSNGSIDSTFNTGTGFDNLPTAIALQSDGKILLSGNFLTYNGTIANRIIRLNSDGTRDTTFVYGSGFNSSALCISIQSDGKILFGGNFTAYNGVSVGQIIRLNSNGSIDSTFNSGTGFNSGVNAIVIFPDGRLFVGGGFQTYNGVSVGQVIRLNSDGSIDQSFNQFIGLNGSGQVQSAVLRSDGSILLGGSYTRYANNVINNFTIINSDGLIANTSFDGIQVVNAPINYGSDYSSQLNGKSLTNKDFVMNQIGTSQNGITRINNINSLGGKLLQNTNINDDNLNFTLSLKSKTTSLVSGFNSLTLNTNFFIGSGFDNSIPNYGTVIQTDGRIIVGGGFSKYNSLYAGKIIRLNSDGSKDATFVNGNGFSSNVICFGLQTDGKILVGGSFASYSGITASGILRLNSNGGVDSNFLYGTGLAGSNPLFIGVQSDGKIILGGPFTSYNGTGANRIIRLNTTGGTDSTFVYGTGFNSTTQAFAIQSDGKIIIGGQFTSYNGTGANRIIRLNTTGGTDSTFSIGTGFNSNPTSILIQSDGKIIIGGAFITYKGVTSNRIIRLNTTGGTDSTFSIGTGFNNLVATMALQSDGKILVGGSFTSYNGVTGFGLVRLNTDGSRDTTFNVGSTGFNGGTVQSLSIQNDGKIIVAGSFTTFNGISVNNLVRLNSNGSLDGQTTTLSGSFLNYNFDYSQYYTARSVPDVGYITGLTTNGGSVTANNGLAKSGANIHLGGVLTGSTTIGIGTNNIIFSGTTGSLKYNSDLSPTFTKYSIVDKNYVTGLTSALLSKSSFTISGDSATTGFTVTHNKNTRDVMIQVYDLTTYNNVIVDTPRITINSISVNFLVAPTTGQNYRVIII